jgi:hypothetical protein
VCRRPQTWVRWEGGPPAVRGRTTFSNRGPAKQQAIHPTQVDIIHSTFVPSQSGNVSIFRPLNHAHRTFDVEMMRASKILEAMEAAYSDRKGAVGLSVNGRDEMIDAPMLRQVRVLCLALAQLVTVNNFVVVGKTNHPARKKSWATHPIPQLINANTRTSVGKVNVKAKFRGGAVWQCIVSDGIGLECTLKHPRNCVMTPGDQSSRLPWAFFSPPLPIARGL